MGAKQGKMFEHGPVNQFEAEASGKKPAINADGFDFADILHKAAVPTADAKKGFGLHPTKSWEPMDIEGQSSSPVDACRSELAIPPAITKRRDSTLKKKNKARRSGEVKKRRHTTTALVATIPEICSPPIEIIPVVQEKCLSPSSSGMSVTLTQSMSVDEVGFIWAAPELSMDLPSEIWVHIFSFLSLEDKCSASSVCKHWNEFIWSSYTIIELKFRNRMDQEKIITSILKKTTDLRELILRDCFTVSGKIFENLPSSLQKFSFYNCPSLTKTVTTANLVKLPELLSIKLANCAKVDDEAVQHFPSTLKECDLSGTCMTDFSLLILPKELEALNISNIPHNFRAFGEMPRVASLTLQSTLSEDNSLQSLPDSIETLDISDSRFLTDDGLKNISHLVNLKTLKLQDCNELKGDFGVLPNSLQHLDLKHSQKVGVNGTVLFPSKLLSLNLWGCTAASLTSDGGISLVKALPPFLQQLNLSQTKITDQALSLMPTSIRALHLFGCSSLSASCVEFFPTVPYLEELDLSWTKISNKSLESIPFKFPRLTTLKLAHCNDVSMEGALMLKNSMPNLQIFGSNNVAL